MFYLNIRCSGALVGWQKSGIRSIGILEDFRMCMEHLMDEGEREDRWKVMEILQVRK